jgi:iron-desferrioxamine transport system substrate-binding protein
MIDLHYFQDLDVEADEFFQIISWEEINRYPADLILVDVRETQTGTSSFADVATWKTLPAIQANQIGPWYAGAPVSPQS